MSVFPSFSTYCVGGIARLCLIATLSCFWSACYTQTTIDEISKIFISDGVFTNSKGQPKTDVAYRNVTFSMVFTAAGGSDHAYSFCRTV